MHRSAFLRNVLSSAAQTVAQMAALFVLYRYLVNRLGIDQVGVWAIVLATASAARVGELGLAGSVTRFVASCRGSGDDRAAGEIVQTAGITVAVLLGIILWLAYPAVSMLLPYVLPPAAVALGTAVLPWALVSMWLGAVSSIWQGGLDGCLRSDIRAGLVTVSTFVFLAMVFVTVPRYGLVGLAGSQVAQGVLLTAFGWVAVRRVIGQMPVLPVTWSRSRFREIAGYGANVQVMAVVMLLFDPATKILFAWFGGLGAAGHFELAQQLVTKMRALIVESNRVVVPLMAATAALGESTHRLYASNTRYLVFLLTPLFAILASLVPAVSDIWLGGYRSQFVIMAVCLTAAWYVNSVTAAAYFAYMGQGQLRWLTMSHVILGTANVALGVTLGPIFGWPGVLAAFAASLTAGSLIPLRAYHREHGLRLRGILAKRDLLLVIACVSAAALALIGDSVAVRFEKPLWIRIGLVAGAAGAMLAAASRHPLAAEMRSLIRRSPGDVRKAL